MTDPASDHPPTAEQRRAAACLAMSKAPGLIRFAARYTPARGGHRELRAVVRAAADYPYATGASRPLRVR